MSRRLNSCLPTHTSATAHLPGPQNPGECSLYFAEGCHLYIALTKKSRERCLLENRAESPLGVFQAIKRGAYNQFRRVHRPTAKCDPLLGRRMGGNDYCHWQFT